MKAVRRAWKRGLGSVAVALVASGCASTRIRDTREVEPTAPVVDSAQARAVASALTWQVDARGGDARSAAVATRVREGVQRGLMDAGLRVTDADGDVRVAFETTTEEFDRAGNFHVFAGRAAGEVRLRDALGTPRDLVGRLDARARGERQLGEAEALANLADALGGMLSGQAVARAEPIRERVAIETVTVTLTGWRRQARSNAALAEYASLFVRVVGAMPGVLDCRLAAQDLSARTADFSVVYLRDAFPESLLNALVGQPELDLRIR